MEKKANVKKEKVSENKKVSREKNTNNSKKNIVKKSSKSEKGKESLDNTYISIERGKINKKYSDEKKRIESKINKEENIDVDLELQKIEEKLLNDTFFVKKDNMFSEGILEEKSVSNDNKSQKNTESVVIEETKKEKNIVTNFTKNKENLQDNDNLRKNNVKYKPLLFLFIKILLIIMFFYFVFGVIFGAMRMNNVNMGPSISGGELLIYYRLNKEYNIGDVVVIKRDGKTYVSRIVALSGMDVDITDDNEVLIDNYPEDYLPFYPTNKDSSSNTFPYKVEKDKYYVLNDYRLDVEDSRTFGSVSKSEIIGKVIAKLKIRDM